MPADLQFALVANQQDYRANQIWESYSKTFPAYERRNKQQFDALFQKDKVKIISISNNTHSVGYIIVWYLNDFIFVEHFEVYEPYRGRNYGSYILQHLIQNHLNVVLETEPADAEKTAARRVSFYLSNGFKVIDKNYIQPPYDDGKKPVNLWLMANNEHGNLSQMKAIIREIVYSD